MKDNHLKQNHILQDQQIQHNHEQLPLQLPVGFYIFSVYKNQKIFVSSRHMFESILSGVLFHGFYLGGVFYELYGSFDLAWYISIALSIFAGLIHLPIKEKAIERVQTA